MESITHIERYWPHELSTKYYAVRLYRLVRNVSFVCRRYKISESIADAPEQGFDGTRESLMPKSHRPHTPHPNAHTPEELKWISDYHRRNPDISLCEMYGKLQEEKGYLRHSGSLYRVFVRLGYRKSVPSTKKISKHLGHYDTPERLGEKWQMDVKYVPTACYAGTDEERFYQYTMLEEATRKRFVFCLQRAEQLLDGMLRKASH